MENILHITLLYDFYSELLTDKQKMMYSMYHLNDLSLQEIGDEFNISPQGVRDLIKRTEKNLEQYEEKLMLINSFLKEQNDIKLIKYEIDTLLEESLPPILKIKLTNVKKLVDEFSSKYIF